MSPDVRSTTSPDVGEDEVMLDEVIARIDESLPILHQHATNGLSEKPPTDRISKRARKIFKEMCDDPLLTDSQDDIRIAPKKNGTHPD